MLQYAKKCSCGYGGKKEGMSDEETRQWTADHQASLKAREDIETAQARQWLQDRWIVRKDIEGPERRKALQAYIATITKAKPGHGWAEIIIREYEAGHYHHEYGYRLACDAMNHEPVTVDRGEPF